MATSDGEPTPPHLQPTLPLLPALQFPIVIVPVLEPRPAPSCSAGLRRPLPRWLQCCWGSSWLEIRNDFSLQMFRPESLLFCFHQPQLTSFQLSVGWQMPWLRSQQGGTSMAMPALSPHLLPARRGTATGRAAHRQGCPLFAPEAGLDAGCHRTGWGEPCRGCAAGTTAQGWLWRGLNAGDNPPSFYTNCFCVCLLLPLLLNNS